MADYPDLLDPDRFRADGKRTPGTLEQRAMVRIDQYRSPFAGWSIYSVDGFFYDRKCQKEYEEATQVVRLLFRLGDWEERVEDDLGQHCAMLRTPLQMGLFDGSEAIRQRSS